MTPVLSYVVVLRSFTCCPYSSIYRLYMSCWLFIKAFKHAGGATAVDDCMLSDLTGWKTACTSCEASGCNSESPVFRVREPVAHGDGDCTVSKANSIGYEAEPSQSPVIKSEVKDDGADQFEY